ncbi:type II secretion system protein [Massilia sp. CCM 9210]|uniref:type II secretion system protein n=1 Tax=Massilia scottii TaxID=3057166 RepID=UPI002796C7CB|nr:type II secretion system protein [Massilia sp. CCM 9210]MDQ1813303.1 type II secretion system protein [Massilia sp. CCM 9210]
MRLATGLRRRGGFSFVEILASAAILGLLASVAVPVVQTTVKRQKERELRIALREIRQAIDAYKEASLANRISTLNEPSGYPATLHDLAVGVEELPSKRRIYFLRRIPRDPFYPDAAVSAVDTWGKRSFASPPDRPSEGDDVFDVYTTSALTGLNGVPYAEW